VLLVTSVDVNIEDINEFFGPRMNKNRWKYDDQLDEEVAKKIVKVYGRVTRKQKVMNKQLLITFAKMIVVEAKVKPMNWASFGAHTLKR
jgi:hypothetical protein